MTFELKEHDFIVSKTDLQGRITYVNKIFMKMAEYSEEELLGKPHSIIRHPSMPRAVFKLLWDRIKAKEEIFAYVLNLTKNKNEYWVFANVTASLDENGNIIGYYSVRRKPKPSAIEAVKPLYKAMLEAEAKGGIEAGVRLLEKTLAEQGASYDEFILSLQQ